MQILCRTQIEPNTDVRNDVKFSDADRIETLKKFYPEWTEENLKSILFLYSKCNSAEEIEKKIQDGNEISEDKKIKDFAKKNNIPYVETLKFDTLDQLKKYFFKQNRKRRSDLIKSAKIPKIFTSARATDFIITDNNETTAKTAIKSITDNSGLFIYGECGTGKTMLASIIANERAEIFKPSMFIGAVDIFHELNPYSSDSKTAAYRKSVIKNAPCLIIDDLGAEKPSDWTKQTLFEIIDFRYRENLQTIITSNFNINELNSRLSEYEGKRIIRRIKAICNLIELNHY